MILLHFPPRQIRPHFLFTCVNGKVNLDLSVKGGEQVPSAPSGPSRIKILPRKLHWIDLTIFFPFVCES